MMKNSNVKKIVKLFMATVLVISLCIPATMSSVAFAEPVADGILVYIDGTDYSNLTFDGEFKVSNTIEVKEISNSEVKNIPAADVTWNVSDISALVNSNSLKSGTFQLSAASLGKTIKIEASYDGMTAYANINGAINLENCIDTDLSPWPDETTSSSYELWFNDAVYSDSDAINYLKTNLKVTSSNQDVLANSGVDMSYLDWGGLSFTFSSAGVTTVTFSGNGITEFSHQIIKMPQKVDGIFIKSKPCVYMKPGDSTKLSYVLGTGITDSLVDWISSDKDVAEVSEGGTVIAKKNGTVTISATTSAGSDTTSVKVISDGVYDSNDSVNSVTNISLDSQTSNVTLNAWRNAGKLRSEVDYQIYTDNANVIKLERNNTYDITVSPVANGKANVYYYRLIREDGTTGSAIGAEEFAKIPVTVNSSELSPAEDTKTSWISVSGAQTGTDYGMSYVSVELKNQGMQCNPKDQHAVDNYLMDSIKTESASFDISLVHTAAKFNGQGADYDESSAEYMAKLAPFITLQDAEGNVVANAENGLTITGETALNDNKNPEATVNVKVNKTLKNATEYKLVLGVGATVPYNGYLPKPVSYTFSTEKLDISAATVSDIADQSYTGSAIEPEFTVTDGDKVLTKDTDYTVEFENNTAVGEATVIIKGAGDYEGTVEKTFNIVPEKAVQVAIDALDAVGDTSAITADSYEAVQKAVDAYTPLTADQRTRLPEGYADKLVAAQKALAAALKEASVIDITHYVSTVTPKMAYTGKAREAVVTVEGLTAGTDYTVTYSNNVKIGTATAVITGTGKYKGTITKTFNIVPAKAALSKVKRGTKKLTAYAKKQAGGVKYQFYAKRSGKTAKYYKTSGAKKVVKKLTSKKTYTVKVRAYKVVNGKTYYGAWSTAKKVKVK